MEFGRHIGKGVWAFADKGLPAIYGLGFIFLVIRVLPENEYGAFVVIQQTIFTLIVALGNSLALLPLTKFAAETEDHGPYIVASLTIGGIFYLAASILLLMLKGAFVPLLDASHQGILTSLVDFLPALFLTAIYRNFATSLLQSTYQVQKIFWIDAVYFLGTLALTYYAHRVHHFSTARDLLVLNIIGQAASSLLAIVFTWKAMSVRLRFDRRAFKQIWDYGKFTFSGIVVYTIYAQMDVIAVSSFTGLAGVAVYGAAKTFTRFFDMTSQVLNMFLIPFSSKAARKGETEKLRITAEKAICFSTLVLLPVFLLMFLVPEELLHILYGGKYDSGASIVRIMSLLALIVPWNALASSYINGMGKVKEGFRYSIIMLAIVVPAYFILTPAFGAVGTSLGMVGTLASITILLLRYVNTIVPISIRNVVQRTGDVWTFLASKLKRA